MRNRELTALLSKREHDLKPWIRGKIPHHYKRMSVPMSEAMRLAKIGAVKMASYYGAKLYFGQSVIAGAFLSGEYETIGWTTSPQAGKTWLFGRIALILAYMGNPVYIAGATADKTGMMMSQVLRATQEVAPEVKKALTMKQDEIDRLTQSLSKKRIGFSNGGFVEPITLGDAYADVVASSGAVGRSGIYMVDEAALCSEKAMQELDRRRWSSVDGKVYTLGMVSNPHKPGYFYDYMTEEEPDSKSLIVWQDILTSIEEERWDEETVWASDWSKNRANLKRYLLCVLDTEGSGMFDTPKVSDEENTDEYTQFFLGVDSAYKGKDNICITLTSVRDEGKPMMRVEEIVTVDKKNWIDGVTSKDIIDDIVRICGHYHISYVCVDIGYGVWLVEGLMQKGVPVQGINFASAPTKERARAKHYSALNGANKRAEMHLDLQNLIDDGAVEFTTQAYEKIKDILPCVTAERKASGKVQICPKSEIKIQIGRSPDELDSVLLSIHAVYMFMGGAVTYIT